MYNTNIPADRELPSTRKLVQSTIIAAITALILLVTVVMPAEYGKDPTGMGTVLGLTKMGEIKMSLAAEAKAEEETAALAASPSAIAAVAQPVVEAPIVGTVAESSQPSAARTDQMTVTLAPNEGTEIKVDLTKGKVVTYSWSSDGGKANYDVHGDSKTLNINYHNYAKGSDVSKEGTIEAAFDGSHGWFWRNRTKETITVTLKTSGEYTNIKHVK